MNGLIRFFDLYSQYRVEGPLAQSATDEQIALWREVLVYLACLAGAMIAPFFADIVAEQYPALAALFRGWHHLLWSVILSFILTAAVFKTPLVSPRMNIVGQIGTGLVAGIFSKTVLSTLATVFFGS